MGCALDAVGVRLGARRAGPADARIVDTVRLVLVLAMPGSWVVGALINVFSVAGDSDTPYVNQMLLQPFLNYNIDTTGWYLVSAPIMTANWRAPDESRWLVPVGGGFGKVFKLGSQPLNAAIQGYYNAERPDGTGETTVRVQLQFLFPTG